MQKPRVTEIKVRMDCNGCVQKIKKALHGITGIHDIYVDFPQQKITVIGWADPEKIVKAIKRTRKSAVICLHTEEQQQQPDQPSPESEAAPPDPTTPAPEPTQPEPTQPPEEQPQAENPPPEIANSTSKPEIDFATPSHPKDQEEIHVIHHHPPDNGYRYPNFQQGYNSQWNSYHGAPQFRDGPPQPSQTPAFVNHSYNTYQPSPNVTEFAYAPSPPRYSRYNAPDNNTRYSAPDYDTRFSAPDYNTRYSSADYNTRYSAPDYNVRYSTPDYNVRYSTPDYNMRYSAPDYNTCYRAPDYNVRYSTPDYNNRDNNGGYNGNGNITSMFSEENPNACRIV